MSSIEFAFEQPWLLLLVIPALAIILIPFFRLPKRRRRSLKKIVPAVLHSVIALLLVLILSGFAIAKSSRDEAVLILMDISDSTAAVRQEMQDYADSLLKTLRKRDSVGVITFAEDTVYTPDGTASPASVGGSVTDMDSALEFAAAQLPADKTGRIILLTDGLETDGDAAEMAHFLATQGIRVDAVYFGTASDAPEMEISRFTAPEGAYAGRSVELTAEIRSRTPGQAKLTLFADGAPAGEQTVAVTAGTTVATLPAVAGTAGVHTYRLEMTPDQDTLPQNNTAYACLKVDEKPAVLIIADSTAHADPLVRLLSQENTVTAVTPADVPKTITALCDYDEVILSNTELDALPKGYGALLETYVSQYGRTLLLGGGTKSFMYGGISGTDLEPLLPVTFRLSERSDGNTVALMLVLDCSLSMAGQISYLQVGAINSVDAMTENDLIGLISFNRHATLDSAPVPGNDRNKENLKRTVSGFTTSQGTYYTEALELAYNELLRTDAAVKHILFLSDGQPSDHTYDDIIRTITNSGITVSTIGVTFSSETLETMAQSSGGRYYYVRSISELPNIMLSETRLIAMEPLITGTFAPVIREQSDLTRDLGALPPLYGYIGMTAAEDATVPLTTESGHPLFATRHCGSGTIACFASDLFGGWSSAWFGNADGRAFIQRMVRTTAAVGHHDSTLALTSAERGKTVDVTVTVPAGSEGTVRLTAASAAGSEDYDLRSTGTGSFITSVRTEAPGTYVLTVTQQNSVGETVDTLETAVAKSYSPEYDAFAEGGEAFLADLCSGSGGEVFGDVKALAAAKAEPVRVLIDPKGFFAVLTVLLLLTDIAVRKFHMKDIRRITAHIDTEKLRRIFRK